MQSQCARPRMRGEGWVAGHGGGFGRGAELLAALHTIGEHRGIRTGTPGRCRQWRLAQSCRLASRCCRGALRRWLPQGCRLASPCCRELGPRRSTRRRAPAAGLLRVQVPTVLSVVAGAHTRRATRPSARVHRSAPVYAWGLFVPAVEAASVRARRASQGRAVWPARSSAARRCGQARAHPRARPQLVGVRAGLTLHPLHCPACDVLCPQ